ncbi:DUF2878 domain-containing protein [Marinihelvus fidelis]|uniref:DUF2878 domain-containing protein n=1 Tax=Marinihelvus fidelis TaxID=2613842 RepID=A0A5N0TLJ4_9GAMM|nr:DUF2878 domain-containing protein [Marinihelvus fidelis]KAA9134199.1 DUF2878 domain-containing protein [Marinihelvus fidelis]
MIKNFLLYNIGWLACVWFAAQGQPWVGVLAVTLIVTAHLVAASQRQRELRTLLAAVLIGTAWETGLLATGLVAYPTAPGPGSLAPLWMIALWANFACTIHYSLAWIRQRPLLAAALGAVGGPLAFVAGEKLGAVVFTHPTAALAVIAAGWAVLLPLLVGLSAPRQASPA